MTRALPSSIEAPAFEALRARGLTTATIALAYAKWKVGARAEDCRFGLDRKIALDCNCSGCREVLTFLYFDQALKTFAMLPR